MADALPPLPEGAVLHADLPPLPPGASFAETPTGAVTGVASPKKTPVPQTGKQSEDISELVSSTGFGGALGAMAPELLTGAGAAASAFPLTAPAAPFLFGLGTAARGSRLAATGLGAISGLASEAGGKTAEAFGAGKTGQEVARIVAGGIGPEFASLASFAAKKAITMFPGMSEAGVVAAIQKQLGDFGGKSGESISLSEKQKKYLEEQVRSLRGNADPRQSAETAFDTIKQGANNITGKADAQSQNITQAADRVAQMLEQRATKESEQLRADADASAKSVMDAAKVKADGIRSTNKAEADRILAKAESEAKKIGDDASKKIGRIQNARVKTKEISGDAVAKANEQRRGIGTDYEHSQTGSTLRERIVEKQKGLTEHRQKQYEADDLQRTIEIAQKEGAGEHIGDTPSFKSVLTSLDEELNSSPAKHTDPKIISQLERLRTALSPQKRVLKKDASGRSVEQMVPDTLPTSITQFVARRGGLNKAEVGGELPDMEQLPKRLSVGLNRLVHNGPTAKSPDAMRELLVEDGFLPPDATINEMYRMLDEEFASASPTHFSARDTDAAAAILAQREFEKSAPEGQLFGGPQSTVPVSFNAVDEIRRSLGEAAFGKPATGYEAIGQAVARDYYKRLSSALGDYSPRSKELISKYELASKELDPFKAASGRRATATDRFDPSSFATDAKGLPSTYFRSRQGVDDLIELTGDKAFVAEQAGNYAARELRDADAKAMRAWINKNSDWLAHPDMQRVRSAVQNAANALERSEGKAATSGRAVEKLLSLEPKIESRAAKGSKATLDQAGRAAERLDVTGERGAEAALKAGERESASALAGGESSAKRVTSEAQAEGGRTRAEAEKQAATAKGVAQKRADLILGDSSPERRIEEIVLSGSPKLWDEVGPIIVADPKGKKAFADAMRNVLADKAAKSPSAIKDTFRKDVLPFIESTRLLSKQEIGILQGQIDAIAKTVASDKEKSSRIAKVIVQAIGGTASSAAADQFNPAGRIGEMIGF